MTPPRAPASTTTLCFRGPGERDHLDPTNPFTIRSGQVLRLLTRQLFVGPTAASGTATDLFRPVPDVALAMPTLDNGGLSADGREYRLRLRRNVCWDAQAARELTAADFVRGLKRVAHPTAAATRQYFVDTIEGMRAYCDAYDATFGGGEPTGPDLAQFHVAHQISGVSAADAHTLVIRLVEAANDFPHILTTAVAAAAPREFDYYVPDSYELLRNAPSAGPYRISGRDRVARGRGHGPQIILEANPRWNPATDPVRHREVDTIRIGAPANGSDAAEPAWAFTTIWWGLGWPGPAGHGFGYGLGPYLVANLRGSPPQAPMSHRLVRQAVMHAVDRAAVRDAMVSEPAAAATTQHSLLPPGSPGHDARDRTYPAAGEHGDPNRARDLLAEAGLAQGTRLRLTAPDTPLDRQVVAALRQCLARCAVTLVATFVAPARFPAVLRAAPAGWDLALADRRPDWYGNNGRSLLWPLLHSGGSANHGGYRDPVVDQLMADALRGDLAGAARLWRRVDRRAMRDLPVIPIVAHSCGPCAASAGGAPLVRWFEHADQVGVS